MRKSQPDSKLLRNEAGLLSSGLKDSAKGPNLAIKQDEEGANEDVPEEELAMFERQLSQENLIETGH